MSSMRRRCVLTVMTAVWGAGILLAQGTTSTPGERVHPDAVRMIEDQDTVVPGCPGSGAELVEPTVLRPDDDHALSTTFEVVQKPREVPVYTQDNTGAWTCKMTSYNLRMYKDPASGEPKFPGPTLRVRRATETTPGDRFSVLLQNNLPPSNEECVWAKGNCNCTDAENLPKCCNDRLPPNGMNCMHGDNTTNLHFHGTHVSPQSPQDWVLLQLTPAGTPPGSTHHGNPQNVVSGEFQYAVDPLAKNQAEGTHWYHPHKHGSTAEQVGNGMAGALIIEGPFDDWLQSQYDRELREKVLVVQNVHDLNFTTTKNVTPIPLINGQLVPQITMYPGEIQRWRFVNANIDADSQLLIDFDGVNGTQVQARQIAMDGVQLSPRNYYCQPLLDGSPCDGAPTDLDFQFSPGNRADFLVKAPSLIGTFFMPYEVFGAVDDQGTKPRADPRAGASSARRLPVSRMRAALDAVAPGPTQPALLSIRVVACPAGETCEMEFPEVHCSVSETCGAEDPPAAADASHYPPLPSFLRPIVPNRPPQFVQFQVLNSDGKFQPNPAPSGRFGIWVKGQNGDRQMQFDDTCANFTAPLDPEGGEEWHISQNGDRKGKPFHVFHIHINPFQVVSTFDFSGNKVTYPEPIWMDSITLPNNTNPDDPNKPSTEVVIRQRFEDYTGVYVLHCHFLGHEDRGMMLTVQTVCPNDPGSFSATSTTQPECTFGQLKPALPPCQPKPAT